ncbi:uncharacterized protein THITE_2142258 [Thermothielavioides terrestris NRRL 8126]|uniref:non-specific serine/threonine protein kinase n=1 Tax=Thermothielavioides terrestris (strain ATCC 38088 / NRRL 8126) TaxID=578455 RepID=G2QSP8_THETT|nr:uncharacterized protein THITE_2142258 [Thermothielavioides terrestris NRRL 8126]AEO64331.1 hypothetical protein THITE_2142258 [Thermothielavioides terrestris NRRL 8126]
MGPSKPAYAIYKPLANGDFLVRRTTDGAIFLGRPLVPDPTPTTPGRAKTAELIRRGAARPAANLLNHENLVSIHDELVTLSFRGPPPAPKSRSRPLSLPLFLSSPSTSADDPDPHPAAATATRMLLWDWNDAGTLQGVLDGYAAAGEEEVAATGGFLPESFVWHVALSLLRALQWLHEGIRETYDAVAVAPSGVSAAGGGDGGDRYDGRKRWWKRVRGTTAPEPDWMPVLHRDVTAANVFLQLPRGVETYGAVKLGNFARCWVSGSVSKSRETPVVAMESDDEVSLGELRESRARWMRDGLGLDKSHRPYTQGSELFALGALLYHMMCGRPLPPSEECPNCGCIHVTNNDAAEYSVCDHDCVEDVNTDEVFGPLASYTAGLKHLASLLLRLNRSEEWRASAVLDLAWVGFEHWAANTEDGRSYRDIFDDIWFRKQNLARLKKRHREAEKEEADLMEIDGDVLVV